MKRDLIKIFIDDLYSTPPWKKMETYKTIIKFIDNTWSSDLLDMNDYGPKNKKGYRNFLIIIDKFSNFVWTIPWKNKYAQPKTDAFPQIVKSSKRTPDLLEADDETKNHSKIFNEVLKNDNIIK